MKQRSGLLILFGILLWSALSVAPAGAKEIPTFYTIEGLDITTPIPFVADIDPMLDITGVFDLDSKFDADVVSLDEYYVIRGYTLLESDDNTEHMMFESMLSPMHYYPQADGPGFVQYIGPDNVFTEFDRHFFILTDKMEHQIQATIQLAHWYQSICRTDKPAEYPAYC